MKFRMVLALATGLAAPLPFAADLWELPLDEPPLKKGPGAELVSVNCQVCHSSDYISTQPRLNRMTWMATVLKMREKYGAPLQTNQVSEIVEYLVNNYGKK